MYKIRLFINIIISSILIFIFGIIYIYVTNRVYLYDEIDFGKYYIDDNEYGKMEKIKWIIIEKDEDSLLLLAKNVIDAKPYDLKSDNTKWENSYLRNFLNNKFYNLAFSQEEKNSILDIEHNINYNEKYSKVYDKVSILSISDINSLNIKDRIMEGRGTKYAIYKGLYKFKDNLARFFILNDVKGKSYRYMKKLDIDYDYALYGPFAYFSDEYVGADEIWVGVRPIIKIKL